MACASGIKASDKTGTYKLSDKVGDYALDLAAWQVHNLLKPVNYGAVTRDGINGLTLREQITSVLNEMGFDMLPPLHFRLETPPSLLVVSPRQRIEYYDRVLLKQNLELEQIEYVEKGIDELGYSTLVVELGGLAAAYPPLISADLPARQVIHAIVEEWAHQYLVLRPLGFIYLLDSIGFRQDPEMIAFNETLAGMMADEVADKVFQSHYRVKENTNNGKRVFSFNFAKEMTSTRIAVDDLLAQGKIEEAEKYMEECRLVFLKNGYKIRKLNQAYFAFHGIYGQDPGSVSPVYADLEKLRKKYSSLADFVRDISTVTSYSQVRTMNSSGSN
jgi:hypothetical protein